MARTITVAIALFLLLPAAAFAHDGPPLHVDSNVDDCSVRFAPELTQSAFHRFAREFGSVSAFKQGSSSETLGEHRFAVNVEEIYFTVDEHAPAWNDTFVHPDAEHDLGAQKAFPMLSVRYGLTDDLDLGAYYTENPNANYGWVGLDAKYRVLRQDDDMPISLAVRGAYTKTLYVHDMDMHAVTADVSMGHTFWKVLTPYVGVGTDVVLVRETSAAVALESEAIPVPRLTAGVDFRWWHVAAGFEAHVAALTSYQATLAVVF